MAKAKVTLKSGKVDVHSAKQKGLAPLDRTPRCELCVHYYRHDLKKKRRGEPQSCHDLNCEPHDHCKLFQRLAAKLTQDQVINIQLMTAPSVDVLEALLLDRRQQLKDYLKRHIRALQKTSKVWVRWQDTESGKLRAARVVRVTASAVMLKAKTGGEPVPEKIKVLDVREFLTQREYHAQRQGTANERDPPTTRRPPKKKSAMDHS